MSDNMSKEDMVKEAVEEAKAKAAEAEQAGETGEAEETAEAGEDAGTEEAETEAPEEDAGESGLEDEASKAEKKKLFGKKNKRFQTLSTAFSNSFAQTYNISVKQGKNDSIFV